MFSTGALGTLSNSGSISGSHGVGLEAGGSLTNNASASITGQIAGVASQGAAATLVQCRPDHRDERAPAPISRAAGSITNQAGATHLG